METIWPTKKYPLFGVLKSNTNLDLVSRARCCEHRVYSGPAHVIAVIAVIATNAAAQS